MGNDSLCYTITAVKSASSGLLEATAGLSWHFLVDFTAFHRVDAKFATSLRWNVD